MTSAAFGEPAESDDDVSSEPGAVALLSLGLDEDLGGFEHVDSGQRSRFRDPELLLDNVRALVIERKAASAICSTISFGSPSRYAFSDAK